jgi:hypothetical protein
VSIFTNETLDKVMKGRAPTLTRNHHGAEIKEKLTRRRFLAVLFGYCAGMSIFLYIFGMAILHIDLAQPVSVWSNRLMKISLTITLGVYWWALSSLLVVTLLGRHIAGSSLLGRTHAPSMIRANNTESRRGI